MIQWIQKQHIDQNNTTLFEADLIYLSYQENTIPTFVYQYLQNNILQVWWPYILLEILQVILTKTQKL